MSLGFAVVGHADVIDEWTPGYKSLKYKQTPKFWSQLDFVLFDGSIVTTPPGSKRLDRRITGLVNVGGDFVFGKAALRPAIKTKAVFTKTEDEEEPKSTFTESPVTVRPSLDFTFINPKGLEIFIGAEVYAESEFDREGTSATVNQNTKYSAYSLNFMRFGLMRRGSNWSGGFYYVNGADGQRDVTLTVDGSSDELRSVDKVQVPPEMGIAASFNAFGFDSEFDLAFVQASESPNTSADGINVVDDHLIFRINCFFPVGASTLGLNYAHKTISYSSNAFVTLDTIPHNVVKLKFMSGDVSSNLFIGGIYGWGSDGLSIPETNESYEVQMMGVTTGLFFSI